MIALEIHQNYSVDDIIGIAKRRAYGKDKPNNIAKIDYSNMFVVIHHKAS